MEAGSSDRLSGWKEIAQHLRRSVRSAQRWERELGLPVQRVKTAHGQVVYGSRSALDAWMARFVELPPDNHDSKDFEDATAIEAGAVEASPVTAAATLPISPVAIRRRLSLWWYAGAAAVVVIGLIAFSQSPVARTDSQPIDLVVAGQTLEARNSAGEVVWSYQFGVEVTAGDPVVPRLRRSSVSVADVDLDGDGRLEYVVPVRFGDSAESYYDVLYAFDEAGKIVWSIQPDQVLVCGGEVFKAPWRIYSIVTSSDSRPTRVWVAFNHHTWWPSLVLEVSANGAQTIRYVQAGWIQSMTEWSTTAGNVLAVGGVLNEWARASVALVDMAGPVSMLPASDPRFRCEVDGTAAPRQVTLFPPQEASRARGNSYVMVQRVTVQGQDMRVEIDGANSIAVIGPNNVVASYEMSDDYWLKHDALAREGKLDHMASDCPERTSPREIRTWTPKELWKATFVGHSGSRLPSQR